jgi:hypothetical protein
VQVMQAVSWPRPNALSEMPLIIEETEVELS